MKYFHNTSWMFAEQMLRMLAGLFVGIWVTRYLGPEQLGIFSYALAFTSIFSGIAKLGLDSIVVRDLVNDPEKRDVYLGTAFWLKLIWAFVTLAIIGIAVLLTSNDDITNLYIFIIAAGLVFQSFEVIDFYFQSKVLSKFVSLCKIAQLFISSLLKLYFIFTQADLLSFVVVSLVDQFILAVTLAYAYSKQNIGGFYLQFDKKTAKILLLNARPLIISSLMISVYSSIDRIIIKEILGMREVGLYAVAVGLTSNLYFIPMLITNSLFPAILNAKNKSADIYNRRLSKLYQYILSVGLLICLIISLFASPIVIFLYGHQYSDSVLILQIYVWNFLLICFSSVFGKWLLSENLQYLYPRFSLVAIVVNIIGCLTLIPLWSIKGAALAALASQLVPLLWFSATNQAVRSQILTVVKIHYNRDKNELF